MTTSDEADRPVALADAMRAHSQALHLRAERTGVIADLLHQRAGRSDYVLFVRNLLPVYQQLEEALLRHRARLPLAPFVRPELFRSTSLLNDLQVLHGADAVRELPVVPSGAAYAAHLAALAEGETSLLLAHVYVRYLGDLNGGQILARLFAKSLALPPEALTFYTFADIADVPSYREDYRHLFDQIAEDHVDRAKLLDEVAKAFEMNIALSQSVGAADFVS